MKRLCNFRIDSKLLKQVDQLEGSRTSNVTKALQRYLSADTQKDYNIDMVDLLKDQVQELRLDKQYLQNQVNALMVNRYPLLERIIHKLRQ